MIVLTLFLLAAAVAFTLSRWKPIPVIPLLLASGVLLQLAVSGIGREVPPAMLESVLEIGLAVLAFAAGIDLSPRRFRHRGRAVAVIGLIQFVTLGLAGFLTGMFLGYSLMVSIYLGCALSASSTLVVVRHLKSRQQMFEPFGRMVTGVLLVQDLVIILVLVVLLRVGEGLETWMMGLGGVLLLAVLAGILHRWLIPVVVENLALDEEQLLLSALALLFAFCGLAAVFSLPFVVGGFFAGFALSAFPMNGLLRGMLGSISSFFLALFFIGLGAMMVMPSWETIGHALVCVVVLLVVTVPLVAAVGERMGLSSRSAIESGLLLSQTSEFSLILVLLGVSAGQVSPEFFTMIAIVTVGTMALTPFIARDDVAWFLMGFHPRNRDDRKGPWTEMKDHVILLGYGRGGSSTVRMLKDAGLEVLVVDDDHAVVSNLREEGVPAFYGDGSDPRSLQKVGARRARAVLCSMRKTRDAFQLADFMQGSDALVVVRTFDPGDREILQNQGAEVVVTSEASTSRILKWIQARTPSSETESSE